MEECSQASKLSFLGGTALRIVHGNSRFSEDIDLDNFGLSWHAFGAMIQTVKQFLDMILRHLQPTSLPS
jgi:predicted nucleotidyltransferase component of viral defense system